MGKCIFSGCKRQMPCYNEHIYYYFFGGTPVIQAESLTEKDPTEISIIFDESSREVKEKYRDVLKQCVLMENGMATYLILGIENQPDIHYAMPVRNMIYDSLNYGEQVVKMKISFFCIRCIKRSFYSGSKAFIFPYSGTIPKFV